MSIKDIFQKKAAVFIAAFFILAAAPVWATKEAPETFDDLKRQATQLLLKKKKTDALQLVLKFLKIENNKNLNLEANEFLVKISQTFLSKEAQDAYESSINFTLENLKESQRLVDVCLSLEPENIDCLVQKIRLSYREKNRYLTERHFKILAEFAKDTSIFYWVDLILQKQNLGNGFKDKSILKKFSEKPNKETLVLTVLEIERSFAAKNFSRAKTGIEILERQFPDYPENIYFKQKLDNDSAEEVVGNSVDANVLYSTKCKGLTRTMARKFRYDFDLCQRGLM